MPSLLSLLILFLSGFCSLVYQVAWERIIRSHFGGDSISAYIVTSTFLLGLGVGAWLFRAARQNALSVYAAVELSIGALALASYGLLSNVAVDVGQFLISFGGASDSSRLVLIVVCTFFLMPPCILMGATLPLVFNAFIDHRAYRITHVGLLYGVNTAGASFGIFSIPFIFFKSISIPQTLWLVGLMNLALGSILWLSSRGLAFRHLHAKPVQTTQASEQEQSNSALWHVTDLSWRSVLFLSMLSGALTLSMEIIFFRVAAVQWPSSAFNFPFILMPFLFFLSMGSMCFTRILDTWTMSVRHLIAGLFFASSLSMLLALLVYRYYFPNSLFTLFIKCVLLVAPFAFFQGGVFPLLLKAAPLNRQSLPERTGVLYLVNAVGAFLCALFLQFVLFKEIGTKWAVHLLFLMGMAGSFSVTFPLLKTRKLALVLVYLGTVSLVGLVPKEHWDLFTFGVYGPNVESQEGETGVVTIEWHQRGTDDSLKGEVRVNGQYMSRLPNHPKHLGLAIFPLSLKEREKILVLGLGGGGMIRELVDDKKTRSVDVVDWSFELPEILSIGRAKTILDDVMNHPKVHLQVRDARQAVHLLESQTYDVIIDNLAMPSWVGATSIKSETYFKEVARVLSSQGVFVLDINAKGDALHAILAGMARHFSHLHVFEGMIAIASHQPFQCGTTNERSENNLGEPNCPLLLEDAKAVMETRKAALGLPEDTLKWLLEGLTPISVESYKSVEPIRDDKPYLEYQL